jgi:hypothetical protein
MDSSTSADQSTENLFFVELDPGRDCPAVAHGSDGGGVPTVTLILLFLPTVNGSLLA